MNGVSSHPQAQARRRSSLEARPSQQRQYRQDSYDDQDREEDEEEEQDYDSYDDELRSRQHQQQQRRRSSGRGGERREREEGGSPRTTTERGILVRALFDFKSSESSSLNFQVGDIIEILGQLESGWWDGVFEGERG